MFKAFLFAAHNYKINKINLCLYQQNFTVVMKIVSKVFLLHGKKIAASDVPLRHQLGAISLRYQILMVSSE